MAGPMNIVGLCGSLRRASYNLWALNAASRLIPTRMSLCIEQLHSIPFYDEDVQDAGFPQPVLDLGARITAADGVLIASPEYNFSVTGVLKNALDWISRLENRPLRGKPVAVLSATAGPLGGARNQYDLRKILGGMEALVLQRPEVFIGLCGSKFDKDGVLNDEPTARIMADQMGRFEEWIRWCRHPRAS